MADETIPDHPGSTDPAALPPQVTLFERIVLDGAGAPSLFAADPNDATAEFPGSPPPPGLPLEVPHLPPLAALADHSRIPGYELLEELGRGNMGVVYRARQVRANRIVALKMILAGGFATPRQRHRFRAEAELVAALHHPHIVGIHEVGEHQGVDYFSLEFCPGGTLKKKLDATPLPPRDAALLVAQLAGAVHHAHQRQIIHRDLKPGNVLLAEDGTPKIADFGIARRLDATRVTHTHAILGTPSYMAPEQAGSADGEPGPLCDVYALGAILYECLTGRPPFLAAALEETLRQVRVEEPAPPRQFNVAVPPDLETICLKCLEKEPPRRYPSAAALAQELRRFLDGTPIHARPAGRIEKLAKWARRQPAVALSLVAVFLSLALGTVVSVYFGLHAQRSAAEARAALDEVEATLADSLVRPLGLRDIIPDTIEREALWKLASLSSDRICERFLAVALKNGETADRLRRRTEWVVPAALGLDEERRQLVRGWLLARLQNPDLDARIRLVCVVWGCELALQDAEFAGAACAALADLLTSDRRLDVAAGPLLNFLVPTLAAPARTGLAERVARTLRPSLPEHKVRPLTEALETILAHLDPADAAARSNEAADRLLDALAAIPHDGDRLAWAAGIGPLVDRLDAARAARTAECLLPLLRDRPAGQLLASTFRRLESRLPEDERTKLFVEICQRLPGFLDPELLYADEVGELHLRFVAPLDRQRRAALGAALAGRVLETFERNPTASTLTRAAASLPKLLDRMEEAKASALARRTVEQAVKLFEEETDIDAMQELVEAIELLAPRLPVEQAATTAAVLADAFKSHAASLCPSLARTVRALVERLPPEDGTKLLGRVAQRIREHEPARSPLTSLARQALALQLLTRGSIPEPLALPTQQMVGRILESLDGNEDAALAEALEALAGLLSPDQALRAARAVVGAGLRTNDLSTLQSHTTALRALLARLDPPRTTELATAAHKRLSEARLRDAQSLFLLAGVGKPLADRLDQDQVAESAARTLRALDRGEGISSLRMAIDSLAVLGPRLSRAQARAAAERSSALATRETDRELLLPLASTFVILLPHLEEASAVRLVHRLCEVWLSNQSEPEPGLAPLRTVLEAAGDQVLVEALKDPFCTGLCRQLVLELLGQRLNQEFANVWQFVAFARANRLPLDLKTPPRRGE
jgi:hypothetical protein